MIASIVSRQESGVRSQESGVRSQEKGSAHCLLNKIKTNLQNLWMNIPDLIRRGALALLNTDS